MLSGKKETPPPPPPVFLVTYDPNGGEGERHEDPVSPGVPYTIRDMGYTRSGYTFDGWNTSTDGSGINYEISQIVTLSSNLTLYAKWKSSPVLLVTYYPNGGTGDIVEESVPFGASYTIRDMGYTRSGYTFDGWNTSADGSGTDYTVSHIISPMTTDLNLYAKWRSSAVMLTVTYYPNGGVGAIFEESVPYGASYTIRNMGYTRSGLSFDGWNSSPGGSGTDYTVGQIVNMTSNLSLYAKWRSGLMAVIYNANGGDGTEIEDSVTPNSYYTIKDQGYTRSGHRFVNWNTRQDGLGTAYSCGQIMQVTANTKLYAKWEVTNEANTVIFLLSNSSILDTIKSDYVALYSNYYLADQGFTKAGYRFSHWNEKRDGTGKSYYNGNYVFIDSAVKTLYAQWIK